MITRALNTDETLLIRQEDHAGLAAQFAARWGNGDFARLEPYPSVVLGTEYHDSHFSDVELELPMDLKAGHPFSHRNIPHSPRHTAALKRNVAWVSQKDRYAAVLVSMHHTGLAQNRYGVISSSLTAGSGSQRRPLEGERADAVRDMEAGQRAAIEKFEAEAPGSERQVRHNYHLLQVFDLMSLYLCCDGYDSAGMRPVTLSPVPTALDSELTTSVTMTPIDRDAIRVAPYPFDTPSFKVCVAARAVRNAPGQGEDACRLAYLGGARLALSWTITN